MTGAERSGAGWSPAWWASAVLVVLIVFPFVPLIAGRSTVFLVDVLHETYPWQAIQDSVYSRAPADPPLWNPYAFCGSPLLADPQMQVAYPPALLHRFLSFPSAYGLYLACHAMLAAVGMGCLLRQEGLGRVASALGAIAFALGTHRFLLSFTAPLAAAHAWLPWVAWASRRLGRSPGMAAGSALGLASMWLVLAGQPQYVVFAAVLGLVAWGATPGWSRIRGMIAGVGGLALWLAATSACWLPACIYIATGTSRGRPLDTTALGVDDLRWKDLLGYLAPSFVGAGTAGSLWGIRIAWARLHYEGAVLLVLAVTGFLLASARRSMMVPALLALIGIALGLGGNLPWIGPLVKSVPPFSFFRHSALWLGITDLALAWLAAIALESVMAGSSPSRRRIGLLWAAVGVGLACTALASHQLHPWLNAHRRWDWAVYAFSLQALLRPGILISTAGVAAFMLAQRGTLVGFLLLVLNGADLLWAGRELMPTVPAEWLMTPSEVEVQLRGMKLGLPGGWGRTLYWPVAATPGLRDDDIVMGRTRRDLVRNLRAALQPNLPAVSGWRMADGQNPLVPVMADVRLRLPRATVVTEPLRRVLVGMGVRVLVSGAEITGAGRPMLIGTRRLYRIAGAEGPVTLDPPGNGEIVSIEDVGPGHWDVICRASAEVGLGLCETFVSGWRATVSGRQTPVSSSSDGFCRITLPLGTHVVDARYDSLSFRIGLLISLAILTSIVSACIPVFR